jgi:hypothetical protein
MSAESDLNKTDYELLSAYIDDMLADSERVTLEQRLQSEPMLQAELAALRQTVAMIGQLPRLKAPRDFSLTPEMVGKKSSARPKIIAFPLVRLASAAASIVMVALVVYLLTSSDSEMSQESMSADVAAYATVAASPTVSNLEMRSSIATNIVDIPTPQDTRDSDGFTQQVPADQIEMGGQEPGYADDETAAGAVGMLDTVGNNGEGSFYMDGTPEANAALEPMMDFGGGSPGDAPPEAAMGAVVAPTQIRIVIGTLQPTIILAMSSPSPEAEMANLQSASTEKDGADIEHEESAEQPPAAPAVMLDMQDEVTEDVDPDRDDNTLNERGLGDAESDVSSDADAETAQEELKIQSGDENGSNSSLGVTLVIVGGGSILIIIIYTILRKWRTP